MKKIYVVASQKGGVAKTTTSIAMASILNRYGYKTLLIDADPSGNSTDVMLGQIKDKATLYDVILESEEPAKLEDAIQETPNGYVVASDPLLLKTDSICSGDPNAVYRLADAINEAKERGGLDDYDYIIIDTQPVINTLLNNCLVAADEVIVPVTADRFAVTGLMKLSEIIESIKKRPNKNLKVRGLLLVMYDQRQKLSKTIKDYYDNTAHTMNTSLLHTAVRTSVAAREAHANKKTLIDYAPNCTTELDYEDFVNLLIEDK